MSISDPADLSNTDPNSSLTVLGGETDSSGNPAGNVVAELTNLANTLGLYTPARDIFIDWFFGNEDTAETLTVAVTQGNWIDISAMGSDNRSIVIQNGNASPDFSYTLYFSRNGLDADQYAVLTVGVGAKSQITQIILDAATYGYDLYAKLEITPTAAQAGTQLDFQAYVAGRGG